MVGSLWTGISGLAGQQTALDNESNNVANVNTIGYKASRTSFADQMYQNKIGKGTQILDTEKLYVQGSLKTTGVNYDVALSGDGFFSVSNTRGGGTSEVYYTRAGNFRMGDSGTLQDSIGNEIQGWAMGEPVTISSNPNIDIFTGDYTKLLSSKIINYNTAVETITAKATDYNLTAQSDDPTVFTGAGLKTKYGKVADVEELIKAYTAALQSLKSDPNQSSATATAQVSHLDLPNDGTTGAVAQDGDEVYVYIDGNKYSQSFITGSTVTDGYIQTMKAFADKISEIPGLKAYVADDTANVTPNTSNAEVAKGIIRIESVVPGQQFTISSTGMVNDGADKPGTFDELIVADAGSGVGALETIRDALNQAVTGKQTDVYSLTELGTMAGAGDEYSYSISIYSKATESTVYIPTNTPGGDIEDPLDLDPLDITAVTGVDSLVTAINGNAQLSSYIEATNINGNLVIRTLDSNFDVEFSGDLKRTALSATATTAGDTTGDIKRNTLYSGREGAGAEFMEITTRIDQTASKGSLQLRLDTLDISDSAFGDYAVDSTGLITMSQDGAMFAVGQIAIARFITNRGLEPIGNNLLQATLASGDPIYATNNDKTAEVKANTLELSTADLSESLVNLMVFQRAFEANAKSITTADTILNTLIQLKR